MAKQHEIVRRIIHRKGFRSEVVVVLNGVELKGKIVQTMKKGQKVVTTEHMGEVVEGEQILWLAHKNGRRIKLPKDHWVNRQAA